jgi:hypothetical protein
MVRVRLRFLQLLIALFASTGCNRLPLPASTGGDGAPSAIGADAGLAATEPRPDRAPDTCAYAAIGSPVTLSTETVDALSPSLASSGSEFGAVWLRSSTVDHPTVTMRLASLGGGVLGGEGLVGPESHSWAELASNGQEYALCWHHDPGMKGRVAFRRINRQGVPLGDPTDLSTTDYTDSCHALIPTPSGWAAVLRGYLPAGALVPTSYRYGLFLLGPTGAPLSTEEFVQVPVGDQTATSLVRLPDGYVVAYWQGPKNGSTTLVIQRFGLDGRLAGPASTISPASGEGLSAPRLVWTGTNLLLFYLRKSLITESEVRDLFIQKLALDGQPAGPSRRLTDPASTVVTSVYAAWTGAEVAVAWIANGPIVTLARLDSAGSRLQADLEMFRPSAGDNLSSARVVVTGTPVRIGVVWEQHDKGSHGQILLAVAGCPMQK